jgi:hypothetical protein
MISGRPLSALAILGLVAGLGLGCGGGSGPGGRLGVSGSVSYKGQPVDQGSIEFIPIGGGKSQQGAAIQGGKYSIPAKQGLLPGKYGVKISSLEGGGAAEPGGLPGPEPKERLPAKYNTKSTLEREIKAGQTTQDFNLD